jgi:hypothetical protein
MLGLKIFDEMNNELPFYNNTLTKKLLSNKTEYGKILEDIEKQKKFVIWIKLNSNSIIKPTESKIIKLQYKDETLSKNIRFKKSFKEMSKLKYLFSIPHFCTKYNKDTGLDHDIFFIISVPESYEFDYEILTKHKIQTITNSIGILNRNTENREVELTDKDKVYIDGNKKIVSIRLPPVKEPLKFDMIYDVIPETNDRIFYAILVFSLIGLSISFSVIGTKIIDISVIPFNQIYHHINTLSGGMITVSLASIGFMKKCATNRTRLWLIFPIIISSIGFLLKDIFK